SATPRRSTASTREPWASPCSPPTSRGRRTRPCRSSRRRVGGSHGLGSWVLGLGSWGKQPKTQDPRPKTFKTQDPRPKTFKTQDPKTSPRPRRGKVIDSCLSFKHSKDLAVDRQHRLPLPGSRTPRRRGCGSRVQGRGP